jgi:hypothetical protein
MVELLFLPSVYSPCKAGRVNDFFAVGAPRAY